LKKGYDCVKGKWRKWVSVLKQDTYALYLASRDRRVPWTAKIVLIVVVAYALSPIDLIPDFIPVLGHLDDMILLPLGIALAIKLIPAEVWDECKTEARTRFNSDLPSSRAAAIVIVMIWFATICIVAWVLWTSLKANSNVTPNHTLQPDPFDKAQGRPFDSLRSLPAITRGTGRAAELGR
jgi:uncharacterized membrane protein YkvA (DUF1232 family)